MKKQTAPFKKDAIANNYGESGSHPLLPQNKALILMTSLNSKKDMVEPSLFDSLQKTAKFNEIKLKFLTKWGVAESQLFDFVMIKFHQQNDHEHTNEITFTLSEWMNVRKLKDKKTARNNMKALATNMLSLQLEYSKNSNSKKGDKGGKDKAFTFMNLFSTFVYLNGTVHIKFNDDFTRLINNGTMPMPYDELLFELDPKHEATSWYIYKELLANKHMNHPQKRSNWMYVSTLLKYCRNLPTYDEVMSSDKAITRRIIEPFLKGLERLYTKDEKHGINYHILNDQGNIVDYQHLTYDSFTKCKIVIDEWYDYPTEWADNYVARGITAKQKAIERNTKRKKEREKKKLLQNN